MMINILYVTITGADDSTPVMDLFDISARFPFVEWGILFSQAKAGVPRYPSHDWVEELCELHQSFSTIKPKMSTHLCGKWVSDVLENGRISFFENDANLDRAFSRVQLNCGRSRLKKAIGSREFWKAALRLNKPVLLGGNYEGVEFDVRKGSQYGVYPMMDASGGQGKETKEWMPPFKHEQLKPERRLHLCNTHCCGYAGGLGPDNIAKELDRIVEVVGLNQCWIDMETKVRTKTQTKDCLDLDKVERVLETVQECMV